MDTANSNGNSGLQFSSVVATAVSAIPASGTPEDAYKAFMDKLGSGFLQAVGDAVGVVVGTLDDARSASANANISHIIEQLQKGSIVSLQFPTPIKAPYTQSTGSAQGAIVSPSGRVTALGGSVSVGGSWGF